MCCVINGMIAPQGASGIGAAYDFMETSYDNDWLGCVVLNRNAEMHFLGKETVALWSATARLRSNKKF